MEKQEYYFGICTKCGKNTALKDAVCAECKDTLPDFMRDLFKGKEK